MTYLPYSLTCEWSLLWWPLSHCVRPVDLTLSGIPGDGAIASHLAWTKPLLGSSFQTWPFLENPQIWLWFQTLQSCLSLLPVYLESILLYIPIVHEPLEITDLFEKLMNAMDTLLRKMHMAIFIMQFCWLFWEGHRSLEAQAQVWEPWLRTCSLIWP